MKHTGLAKESKKLSGSSRKTGSRRREATVRVALCLNKDGDCGDLHVGTLYAVIQNKEASSEGLLRIVDESGEDYLYPTEYFVLQRLRRSLANILSHRRRSGGSKE